MGACFKVGAYVQVSVGMLWKLKPNGQLLHAAGTLFSLYIFFKSLLFGRGEVLSPYLLISLFWIGHMLAPAHAPLCLGVMFWTSSNHVVGETVSSHSISYTCLTPPTPPPDTPLMSRYGLSVTTMTHRDRRLRTPTCLSSGIP